MKKIIIITRGRIFAIMGFSIYEIIIKFLPKISRNTIDFGRKNN